MKKVMLLILTICLCAGFCACGISPVEEEVPTASTEVTCPKCGTGFRGNTTYARMIEKYGYCGFGLCDKD